MADIELLRKIGKITYFDKNQMLFMQNDPGNDMYIALKGVFGVYINSFTDFPMRVAGIPIGKCFGEMSVIDGSPRSATIISEDDGAALAITKENLPSFLKSSPEMARSMLKTLSDRVASTTEAVRQSGKTVPDLSELLREPTLEDSTANYNNMIMLTQRIRELNDLLLAKTEDALIEIKENTDTLTLLPSGIIIKCKLYPLLCLLLYPSQGYCTCYCTQAKATVPKPRILYLVTVPRFFTVPKLG